MSEIYGYARVSTKDQNLQRQIDDFHKIGIDDKNIYSDMQSGKNFTDRIAYLYLKKVLKEGDTLVIKDLKRLGRNKKEMSEEWKYFIDNGINVRVLDLPALNIDYSDDKLAPMLKMIKEVVFSILSWQAEDDRLCILETQRQGIEAARKAGKSLGRPARVINVKQFKKEYELWQKGEQTASLTMKKLGWSKSFFYGVVKKYENEILTQEEKVEEVL